VIGEKARGLLLIDEPAHYPLREVASAVYWKSQMWL